MRRRRLIIARPVRVFMRVLNPTFFRRLRLLLRMLVFMVPTLYSVEACRCASGGIEGRDRSNDLTGRSSVGLVLPPFGPV